jgi:hypothetical protein
MMLLILSMSALAGPTRCVAFWTGPAAQGCNLRDTYKAEATALSEAAARKHAVEQLAHVLELAATAQQAVRPALGSADFLLCSDVAATAFVDCFDEPQLRGRPLCFASFDDPACWTGEPLTVEVAGVRALAVGRSQMCQAVDDRIVEQAYTDMDVRRAQCAASCEARTTVRCPTGP